MAKFGQGLKRAGREWLMASGPVHRERREGDEREGENKGSRTFGFLGFLKRGLWWGTSTFWKLSPDPADGCETVGQRERKKPHSLALEISAAIQLLQLHVTMTKFLWCPKEAFPLGKAGRLRRDHWFYLHLPECAGAMSILVKSWEQEGLLPP